MTTAQNAREQHWDLKCKKLTNQNRLFQVHFGGSSSEV